ncbi:ferredoxin--NADP reductase [Chelatococcus reniformis]|uniref:ferredoxin--NADP(+) reductase n=1 Tax=Chelatococcus reniformis TaxID=1494448 RepID=A0A916XDZ5_9HYPH|nr:ferredoxin--NADP reductase [Chelatococcus reniformis]GGC66520.1 ferredoxin--NADP(+) reductase [Chelatococcus reniformis]
MSNLNTEKVLNVRHWTDRLFSFQTTRDPGFRFRSGEFVMIGIEVNGKPLLRAYSVASANYDDKLEFFSIKVQNGPLTSRLQHLAVGDSIVVGRKPTGTLVLDNLENGRNIYLLATGTGLAPFASLIRDPEIYNRFDKVVLVHGCREVAELSYGEALVEQLRNDEFLSEDAEKKLLYYPTVTREPFRNRGRITDLMQSGKLYSDLGLEPLSAAEDRVMICGSPEMLKDLKDMLLAQDFSEGNTGEPGQFVIEKAFVEK